MVPSKNIQNKVQTCNTAIVIKIASYLLTSSPALSNSTSLRTFLMNFTLNLCIFHPGTPLPSCGIPSICWLLPRSLCSPSTYTLSPFGACWPHIGPPALPPTRLNGEWKPFEGAEMTKNYLLYHFL